MTREGRGDEEKGLGEVVRRRRVESLQVAITEVAGEVAGADRPADERGTGDGGGAEREGGLGVRKEERCTRGSGLLCRQLRGEVTRSGSSSAQRKGSHF